MLLQIHIACIPIFGLTTVLVNLTQNAKFKTLCRFTYVSPVICFMSPDQIYVHDISRAQHEKYGVVQRSQNPKYGVGCL